MKSRSYTNVSNYQINAHLINQYSHRQNGFFVLSIRKKFLLKMSQIIKLHILYGNTIKHNKNMRK